MKKPRRRFLQSTAVAAAGLAMPCDSGASPQESPRATSAAQEKKALLPTLRLGKHEVTRLIIGANPFYGYSHFNRLFSQHMVEWATTERVCQTLRQCQQQGINTWQFSHNPRSLADIRRHREEGGKLQWILLSSREMEENLDKLGELAKLGPIGMVHHGGTAERRWRAGEQSKVREFLKRVRDAGVMVGLSLHNPSILEEVESENWDIDFYMTAVYYLTRTQEQFEKVLGQRPLGEVYLPQDPPRMFRAIRQTRKTCLCYKVLAAGRLTDRPEEIDQAFRTTFQNIKPQDGMIIGMYPRYIDQVADNAARVRRILGVA